MIKNEFIRHLRNSGTMFKFFTDQVGLSVHNIDLKDEIKARVLKIKQLGAENYRRISSHCKIKICEKKMNRGAKTD